MGPLQLKINIIFVGLLGKSNNGVISILKNYNHLINGLLDANFEISLFSFYVNETHPNYSFASDIELSDRVILNLIELPKNKNNIFKTITNYILTIVKLFAYCSSDGHFLIFLPSNLGILTHIYLLFNKKNKKIITYIGGNYVELRLKKSLFSKIKVSLIQNLEKLIIRKSNLIVTSSYEYFYNNKEQQNKLVLTSPLMNVKRDDLNECDFNAITVSPITITFCGQLRNEKGVHDLLEAFFYVTEIYKNEIILKFIGDGSELYKLKNQARSLHIQEKVKFVGHLSDRNELIKEIKNSSIIVSPSYSEGFPRVLYESFTLGVPSIVTPVGGIPFFLCDKVHSLFFKPGDILQLKDKIYLLITNPSLREQLIQNAYNLMKNVVFPRIQANGELFQVVTRFLQSK